jgi:glutathionyl-hydroquinone reductase
MKFHFILESCDMETIMAGYFKTLFPLNPGGIQPHPPATCDKESLLRPHGREALSSAAGTPLEAAAVS